MRIAQVAPLCEAVPPRLYGGTERVVAHLTDALVELGHEVTLFASADAETRAKLVPCRDQAIRLDPSRLKSEVAAHLNMMAEVRRRACDFDAIHFHTELLQFPLFEDIAEQTITTLHGRLDLKDLPEIYRRWSAFPLVSISDFQREPLPYANWLGTVHHGFPPERYTLHLDNQGYLAFLGRISPEKRPDRAIEIARRCGKLLKIAAKVDEADLDYWNSVIEPMILREPLVEFVGEIGDDEKSAFLGGAEALLFPIDWPEPFGLVMIEAMACGAPVIAFDCGSVPEVVEDGLTGFIVEDVEDAAAAVARLPEIRRTVVRRRFEARFSAMAMARRYLDLYAALSRPEPEPIPRRPGLIAVARG
jgi:glycosyltransferase involved in cell wall biosynthesis